MRRRSFLVGVSTIAAGCSRRDDEETTIERTVEPIEVPPDSPDASSPEADSERRSVSDDDPIAIGESRFGPETPCPEGVVCFHRIEPGNVSEVARPLAFLAPSRELFSGDEPIGRMYVENAGTKALTIDVGWTLLKYTGHRWVQIQTRQTELGERAVLEAGERWGRIHLIERLLGFPILGPGLYARVEEVHLDEWDGSLSIGSLFEVIDTRFRMGTPQAPTARDDGVVRIVIDRSAEIELVFERVENADDPIELVPEAVASVSALRKSIPHLRDRPVVRIVSADASVLFNKLDSTTVRDRTIEPGKTLAVEGIAFEPRLVDHNR